MMNIATNLPRLGLSLPTGGAARDSAASGCSGSGLSSTILPLQGIHCQLLKASEHRGTNRRGGPVVRTSPDGNLMRARHMFSLLKKGKGAHPHGAGMMARNTREPKRLLRSDKRGETVDAAQVPERLLELCDPHGPLVVLTGVLLAQERQGPRLRLAGLLPAEHDLAR